MNKVLIAFIFFFTSVFGFSQTFKIIGNDTVNFKDKKGQKNGKWIESVPFGNEIGTYKNNKKDGVWRKYSYNGELEDEERFDNGKKIKGSSQFRRIRARFGNATGNEVGKKDHFILDFDFYENTVSSGKANSPQVNGVTVSIFELINSKYELFSEINSGEAGKIKNIVLEPNKDFKIRFSKIGYLSREFSVNTHLYSPTDSIRDYNSLFYINFYRKFDPKLSPDALKMPSGLIKYSSNIQNLSQDNLYFNYLNDKFYSLDKKIQETLITELENTNNTEVQGLQELNKQQQELNKLQIDEISKLNSEKLLKEAEARANKLEADQKTKALELISKEKLLQQYMLKEQQLLSDKKEKEINSLSQTQLINELKLTGQESELKQQKIEAEKKKQELENARTEQELKTAEIKQQKIIRNFILAGLVLVLGLAFLVYRSLLQNKKAKSIIEEQKLLVEEKQKEIVDSIKYAKRIQSAHLPTNKYIDKNIDRLKDKV